MKKLIYNRTLFVIATAEVLTTLILSSLNYIDIGLLVLPLALPYLYWLFKLIKTVNK